MLAQSRKKATYDAELKQKTVAPAAIPVAAPIAADTADQSFATTPAWEDFHRPASTQRRKPQKASGMIEIAKIVAGSLAGLAIGYLILCMIAPQYSFFGVSQSTEILGDTTNRTPAEQVNDNATEPIKTTVPNPIAKIDKPKVVAEEKADDRKPSSEGETGDNPTLPPATEPAAETDQERLNRLSAERDKAMTNGGLVEALTKVKELADLTEGDAFEMQAELVLGEDDSDAPIISTTMRADALITIMEAAIGAERLAFVRKHQDDLLRLTRKSGDADLIRRATLTVLKIQAMKSGD